MKLYPFNPEDYPRGSTMSAEDIETAFGVSRKTYGDHKRYRLAQMQARDILRKFHGNDVAVTCRGDAIHVLQDNADQFIYGEQGAAQSLKRFFSRSFEACAVSPDTLNAEQQRRQANLALTCSRIKSLLGLRDSRRRRLTS